jgi:BolA family transcriptional regulator, general stress-responsive regulator
MKVKHPKMSQIHPQIEIYQKILVENLQPSSIEIVDDSHQHAGHAGHNSAGASHLTLNVVSDKFTGLSRVARHRLVYDVLGNWMKSHIHALVINAKTPSEK